MSRYAVTYTVTVDADSPEQAAQRLRDAAASDDGCNYQISDLAYVDVDPAPVPGAFWVTPMTDAEVADWKRWNGPDAPAHEISIASTGPEALPQYRAECACGFRGLWLFVRESVVREGDRHLSEVTR